VVEQPQVLVAVDRLKVAGHRVGERDFRRRVPALGQARGQDLRHLPGDAGKDVLRGDQRPDLLDDLDDFCLVHSVKKIIRLTKRQDL
jgi:hypothetical protein